MDKINKFNCPYIQNLIDELPDYEPPQIVLCTDNKEYCAGFNLYCKDFIHCMKCEYSYLFQAPGGKDGLRKDLSRFCDILCHESDKKNCNFSCLPEISNILNKANKLE